MPELEELLVTVAKGDSERHEQTSADNGKGGGYGPSMDREYLTRTDVATMTGVHTRTVDRWVADGLHSSKIGGARRISRADLKDFIDQRATR